MQEILQKAASLQAEIDALEVLVKEMSEINFFYLTFKDKAPELTDEIHSVVYNILEFDIELDAGLEKLRELFNKRAHLCEKKKELSDKWNQFIIDDPRNKLKTKQKELANLLRSLNI